MVDRDHFEFKIGVRVLAPYGAGTVRERDTFALPGSADVTNNYLIVPDLRYGEGHPRSVSDGDIWYPEHLLREVSA